MSDGNIGLVILGLLGGAAALVWSKARAAPPAIGMATMTFSALDGYAMPSHRIAKVPGDPMTISLSIAYSGSPQIGTLAMFITDPSGTVRPQGSTPVELNPDGLTITLSGRFGIDINNVRYGDQEGDYGITVRLTNAAGGLLTEASHAAAFTVSAAPPPPPPPPPGPTATITITGIT